MARRDRSERKPIGIGKTIGMMLLLGIVLGWASVFLIPVAERVGLSHRIANRIPFLGFSLGLAWGVSLAFSKSASAALKYCVTPLAVGIFFWFPGLLLGGLCVAFGMSEQAADYVPFGAFMLGMALGSAPLAVRMGDAIDAVIARVRGKSAP